MGLPRQDKQQPIIIQNVDLLLPGQIKSKRKPLCTANLYLSAASFRRQGGITLLDDSECFQSSSPDSRVCIDVLGVSGCERSSSSLSDHVMGIAEPVLAVRHGDIRLDQRQQIPILQVASNTTTSINETQLRGSRSTGENPAYNPRSADETPLHSSKSTSETPPYSSKSLRKHHVSQPGSTYQNVRTTSANDFSTDNNDITTNHSGKIKVPKKRFSEDKSVLEVTQVSASVLNQKSHQQDPHLAATHSGRDDKTVFEISVEFELNQSQLGSKLVPQRSDGLSTTASLSRDCADGGHVTDIFECGENSNFHVKDKTMTAAGKEIGKKTFTECDWLYNFEAQTTPVNEACTRPTREVHSERCAPKGEETATKMKRVSFKLSQDKEVDTFSHGCDVSAQKMVDTYKRNSGQLVSSVDANDVALFTAINVDLIPQLVDIGHLPGYPFNPPAQPSCVNDAYHPWHHATARRNLLFSLPPRLTSPASLMSAESPQPREHPVNHQRLIGYEFIDKRRTGANSFTNVKEEVTSPHNVSKHQKFEQLPHDKNYQFHRKLHTSKTDNNTDSTDSVRMPNKTVSKRPETTSHIDRDLASIEPNSENYIDGDSIFIKPNTGSGVHTDSAPQKSQTQSEVNTDYLRRLYSSCGNRAHISGSGSVFDKDIYLDATRLPEDAGFSRDVGCINRRTTNKCVDKSINTCVETPEEDKQFTAEQVGGDRHSACPRARSVSAKGKSFGVKGSMKYVDRCLFQIDRRENERTPMNKRLEKLIVSNLRLHRPTLFLDRSRTGLQ